MPNTEELDRRFTYHPPDEYTRPLHEEWRKHERWYAEHINDLPGGDTREKATALTKLEEATFWVHAHIARNLHPRTEATEATEATGASPT